MLRGAPVWLSVLAGVIGGLSVVALHVFAGYLATKTIRYRVTGLLVGAALIAAGLAVGVVLTYNTAATAVATEVGIGRCGP